MQKDRIEELAAAFWLCKSPLTLIHKKGRTTMEENKWTLAEAKNKLFGDDPELSDLGISRRQITVDISIAEGSDEDGEGLSVILTPSGQERDDNEDGWWNFSFLVHYRDGISGPELVEIIAKTLGIGPEERVWEDGGQME